MTCRRIHSCLTPLSFSIIILIWLMFVMPPFGHTEVTLDGSLGPQKTLGGPDYVINAGDGTIINQGNLFHSFGSFSLDTGESATFTGPNNINNIIGRVTGGNLSSIDGVLRSTIPNANLFLINQ